MRKTEDELLVMIDDKNLEIEALEETIENLKQEKDSLNDEFQEMKDHLGVIEHKVTDLFHFV